MKKLSFLLLLAMIVAGVTSCKRDYTTKAETVTVFYKDGSTVTKTYAKTAPQRNAAGQPVAQLPELSYRDAKKLLNKHAEENELTRFTKEINTGYYECNDVDERTNLYKLAVNNIITFKCDEILNGSEPTYWVTVELTWKGKLMVVNKKKLFPEDKIDWEATSSLLTPVLDQDEWGIPTYDNQVDAEIVNSMRAFYMALADGKDLKTSLMSADLKCAVNLLETLESFDVNTISPNPFYRYLSLTAEMVDTMKVMRLPRLEDAYMVSLGGEDFLYAITNEGGMVEICDLVAVTPEDDLCLSPTVCSIAGRITEAQILAARAEKRRSDELARLMAEAKTNAKKAPAVKKQEVPEEHFDMCDIRNSGIYAIEHNDPTLYQLAKEKENKVPVELLASKIRVKKVRDIRVVMAEDSTISATGLATVRTTWVTPLGRIFMNLKNGDDQKIPLQFAYDDYMGWQLTTAHCNGNCADDCAEKCGQIEPCKAAKCCK